MPVLSKEALILIQQAYALTVNEPDSVVNAANIKALVDSMNVHLAALPGQPALGAIAISGFLPASGAKGSRVVITGSNFTFPTSVSVNGKPVASFRVNSATQITATLTSTQASGLIQVGTAVSATAFTVV